MAEPVVSTKSSTSPPSIWATFVLHEYVELDKLHMQVERELRNILGKGIECFLPVHNHKVAAHERTVLLFEGYVFVKHDGTQDFEYKASRLRGMYVDRLLKQNGKPSYVNGKEIDKYRDALAEQLYPFQPTVGDMVTIVEGTFKNMQGKVLRINMIDNSADVIFKTRTREVTAKDLSFCAMILIDIPSS